MVWVTENVDRPGEFVVRSANNDNRVPRMETYRGSFTGAMHHVAVRGGWCELCPATRRRLADMMMEEAKTCG